VTDETGKAVAGATIKVMGQANQTTSDTNGNYSFSFFVFEKSRLRIHAFKGGFLDAYLGAFILGKAPTQKKVQNFVLMQGSQVLTLNTKQSVNGILTFKNGGNTYSLKANAFLQQNNSPYEGEIKVYALPTTNFLKDISKPKIDTFMEKDAHIISELSNILTFPLIFTTSTGERLEVAKSNPLTWTTNLKGQIEDAQSEATAKILTETVAQSKKEKYSITEEYLYKKAIFSLPTLWLVNSKTGGFYNQGMSFLDTNGNVQTLFYTLPNQ